MSQNPLCPEHGLESILKDKLPNKRTGIGFYPPFFGCPWKGTDVNGKTIYCHHHFSEKPSQDGMIAVVRAQQTAQAVDKDKSISWMNAKNCAAQLLSKDQSISAEAALNRMREFADAIYRLQPPT